MKIRQWMMVAMVATAISSNAQTQLPTQPDGDATTDMAAAEAVAPADEQKEFTLEDLNYGGNNYRNMVAKTKHYAWWGDRLMNLEAEQCYMVQFKPNGKKNAYPLDKSASFTLDALNQWIGGTDDDKVASLLGAKFPYPKQPCVLVRRGKGRQVLVNFKTHKVEWEQDLAGISVLEWNAASRHTAYTGADGYNLFVRTADGRDLQVTTDGSHDLRYAISPHRDEFGYEKGTFWSPDGQKLLFTRQDQSMVTDYPLVDIPLASASRNEGDTGPIATTAPEKYPYAGQAMHKLTLGIFSVDTQKTIYLQAGDPTDRYFTNPAWSPDGKTVYLFELNRDQNDCRLVAYSSETGERIAELYRETHDKYVEPLHPIVFLPWDDSKFIMQSQRDGYNHLYLFSTDGQMLKQLTQGQWVVMDMLGFNKRDRQVLIASNELSPIQQNIFAVDVASGKRTRIDEGGKGWHYGSLSSEGIYLVDNYSEPATPRNITLVSTATGGSERWFTAPNPWEGYKVPEYRCGTIKAADGQTDLYYRMVMPVDFDPAKQYPTIIYVYGGPHAHNVDARWNYCSRGWETYMAQKGYLLFILDNRGSENRGRDFEQTTFRHLGDVESEDQYEGVKFLQSLPYVDQQRMGVHGWSFGGFMTINLMTRYPDVFKVGVAGGPVIDWKWYEVMYGERYMDTPQTNADGYASSSLLPRAKDLKGRLQIIIGLSDPVVVPQHAITFIQECVQQGTQPDFFVYPGEPHNMRGHQSTHLHERISRYFDDYLK